ncbi:MAG: hypothetical protein FJY56_12465 [Betaproteobacteria bacterium]|nr:hypothetical protein [Betaproteobacteria bacterium]
MSRLRPRGAFVLLAPAAVALALRQKIAKDVTQALAQPDVKERLQRMEFDVAISGPENFEQQLRNDVEIFRKIAKQAGLIVR